MSVAQQLIINKSAKIIGITGDKGRNILANQMALELSRSGKNVVLSHVDMKLLPTSGKIIYEKDEDVLIRRLRANIKRNKILYIGSEVRDRFFSGISTNLLEKIKNFSFIDYVILFVGSSEKVSIFSKKEILKISKMTLIDELIYCFRIDCIDTSICPEVVSNVREFAKNFNLESEEDIIKQQVVIDYLTDLKNGSLNLFKQNWPCLLVFTDVDSFRLENRSINISRDLNIPEIKYVFTANLKENLIKKV